MCIYIYMHVNLLNSRIYIREFIRIVYIRYFIRIVYIYIYIRF